MTTPTEIAANDVGADFSDRELNHWAALLKGQLPLFHRDLKEAEALFLSLAPIVGSNATERERNAILFLSGDAMDPARVGSDRALALEPLAADAWGRYRASLHIVDKAVHDLAYLEAEQKSRRHELKRAEIDVLDRYTSVVEALTGLNVRWAEQLQPEPAEVV